jgi:hypothetical protein
MMDPILDRLSRRGSLTIDVKDGTATVRFTAPGPYRDRGWCTSDEADFWSHLRLGATHWNGEGTDLGALLTECENATRPPYEDADSLRSKIEHRRETRTTGPPLPTYGRGRPGWRPGIGRWLTTTHTNEYLGGYLRDLTAERTRIERS